MWPCLLLALALLGTVPADQPAPRQLQGVPAGETPRLRYTVVRKFRTYARAKVRGHGARGRPGSQALFVPRQHCQEVPVGTDGLWRSRICLELRPFICQY
ncbi:hypothetical protein DUI87_25437 [Hirundo rustica rustica]|uniref:C-type lectin domain-containing protein n=1 Tax=Hirundo rustica rustica TaxID=333673 RepID=A0A3M0JGV5_HIRRU|nr:hypothetical protein DUI87_25437 [Hirundo rustica rustica]